MDIDPQALKDSTLATVREGEEFWVCNGTRVSSLKELADVVEQLPEDVFRNHVNPEGKRNDFAVWVQDVLRNQVLARDLNYQMNLEDQQHFVKTIRDHIAWLESV